MFWPPLLIAFALSAVLIPIVRQVSIRLGQVAAPRADRWHKSPTPIFGGVGMFLAFAIALLVTAQGEVRWGLFAASCLMFAIGLYDDLHQLSPPAKLIGQLAAAMIVVFSGYTTRFFSSPLLNILVTVVWLVGITNAINLLDNMDGLAGGISLIAAGFLSYFFWLSPHPQSDSLLFIALALAGSILGFLRYNFPPASIFMGDSGSLFIGFTLASIAIARTPQASNVFAVMSVPTLIFLLPILDTSLVTFTRLLRGQSPAQGGRDHTSHRLVAFGLTERQAVLVLYGVAVASGVAGAVFESFDYTLSLVLIPILVLTFALLAAYLGRLTVVDATQPRPRGAITTFMLEFTFKRRIFEIALDFFLISITYYMAFWTRFAFRLTPENTQLYLISLPVALTASYTCFFLFRVYRGVWRYFGISDLTRFARAVVASTVVVGAIFLVLYPSEAFSPVTFFLFAVFLFFGLAASRSSFKVLDQIYGRQARPHTAETRVLIYGAGDLGEMALRWILRNPALGYDVVGLLDDDPYKRGRQIHGADVLGDLNDLEALLPQKHVDGLIITSPVLENAAATQQALETCRAQGVWVRSLRLEFELLETPSA